MRKFGFAVAMTAALSLPACATINDASQPKQASTQDPQPAQGRDFCTRNETLCIVGAVVVLGGAVALLASKSGY